MGHGHFVITIEDPVAEGFEDAAYSNHAESVQLGGAERAHASRSENMYPLGQSPKDFLVPYGRHGLEVAINKQDDLGAEAACADNVALPGRAEYVTEGRILMERPGNSPGLKSRTAKDDDPGPGHGVCPAVTARARRPGM